MNVELADVRDAGAILDLQKLAYQSEADLYNDYTIPPLIQTLEGITADFSDQLFLKASVEGKIIGSVRGHLLRLTCFIGRLIVHPAHQRRGIGTALMDEIEKRFQGAKRFELFTGHKSEGNLRFYERLGYRPFRREKVSETLELVYMEKTQVRPVNRRRKSVAAISPQPQQNHPTPPAGRKGRELTADSQTGPVPISCEATLFSWPCTPPGIAGSAPSESLCQTGASRTVRGSL